MNNNMAVAVVGCGIVGGATAQLLVEDEKYLQERTGLPLHLKYIVDKNFDNAKSLGLSSSLYEEDLNKVCADPEVAVVVELVGGTTIARDIIKQALSAGKHVVTANKALLAHYGPELFALAREKKVSLGFEASCGGGIPIIRALYDGLMANRIEAFYGIVNGTCNYILTEMIQTGKTYAEALADAQADGLAEADPTLDVSGMDSAHKLTIMGSLSFGKKVDLDTIPVTGIDSLELMDVEFGQELDYIIKLLAIAQKTDKGVSLKVCPAFIGTDHPLAWISGPFNAVSVYGHAVGHTMYYGRGAGGRPTGSAVVSDIISVLLGTIPALFSSLSIWPDQTQPIELIPPGEAESRFYIRMMVKDQPGVFARIASVLSEHDISISSVLQKEPTRKDGEPEVIPVVITTHTAKEGNIEKALTKMDSFDSVAGKSVCINIVDEHEEKI